MAIGGTPDAEAIARKYVEKPVTRRHMVVVSLNDEQMAAAEGWRNAHGMSDQAEALGELVRLGLLSEIAKIYRLVSDSREDASSRGRNGRMHNGAKANGNSHKREDHD